MPSPDHQPAGWQKSMTVKPSCQKDLQVCASSDRKASQPITLLQPIVLTIILQITSMALTLRHSCLLHSWCVRHSCLLHSWCVQGQTGTGLVKLLHKFLAIHCPFLKACLHCTKEHECCSAHRCYVSCAWKSRCKHCLTSYSNIVNECDKPLQCRHQRLAMQVGLAMPLCNTVHLPCHCTLSVMLCIHMRDLFTGTLA